MNALHWPLSVLSRSVEYKNLTAASKHVGLSQPQLSRLIKQIEEELEVTLLDRSSPRHSTWTPAARAVAEIYHQSERSLEAKLAEHLEDSFQKQIKIGCLEGLSSLARTSVHQVLSQTKVNEVTLNLYDLNLLEAKFLSGELDAVFTSRDPSRKKFSKVSTLGYQTLSTLKGTHPANVNILSPFEDQILKNSKKPSKKLISNSLAMRRNYQLEFGGSCTVPSEVKKIKKLSDGIPVLLIGKDSLAQEIWHALNTEV